MTEKREERKKEETSVDRVAFVILTWNSQSYILDCIHSLASISSEKICGSVVIVDNGSTDATVEYIKKAISEKKKHTFEFHLIELPRNYGTTISRNKGIKYLTDHHIKFDYLCILDSDTEVSENAIIKLIDVLKKDGNIGIVGPRMHNEKMIYQESGRAMPTLTEKILKVLPVRSLQQAGDKMQEVIKPEGNGCIDVGYLISACWMMSKSSLRKIGMLDEKIFYAPEDVDYCIRSWKKNLRVVYCYDADILHRWQRLSRKKILSKHNFEHIKGLFYLFCKHRYLFNGKRFWKKTA